MAPTVSVIIPVRNAADTLGRALSSIAAQTYRDFEVIIVDDASTEPLDGRVATVQGLRVSIVRLDQHSGAAAARNAGVLKARGKYLAFLDADDEWLPEKLQQQISFLAGRPRAADGCCTSHYMVPADGSDPTLNRPHRRSGLIEPRTLLFGCNLSPGSTLMVARRCFKKVGLFDESLNRLEDWDWLLRFVLAYELAVIDLPLACIYISDPPRIDHVLAAIDRLRAKFIGEGFLVDRWDRRRFKSALLLETAAAYHRYHHTGHAIFYAARAFLDYPFRNYAFFARLAHHLLRRRKKPATIEGKVLHLITGLHTGGAERTLATAVLARPDKAVPPTIAALTPGGAYAAELKAAGLLVLDLGMGRGLPNPFAVFRLASIIRHERPEVIQSWMYHADLMALLALMVSGRRRSTRLYWGIRCSDMDLSRYGIRLRLIIRLCAWLSRRPDGVVANSEAGREVHKRLGYRPKRFEVVDNGIEPARFTPLRGTRAEVRRALGIPASASVIATVARVDPMKDYDGFLAALGMLPGVQALAIGAGTEALPETAGLHRLGWRDDVPRLLACADILVSSSAFGEGFSNAIAEGMAAGLPVVATDVGDARRIVDSAGTIVPPGDHEALAGAIRALIGNRAERRRLGAAGRRRVIEAFSVERMVAAFERIHR